MNVHEAVQILSLEFKQLINQTETLMLPVSEAENHIVAMPAYAQWDIPDCPLSAMDGYAIVFDSPEMRRPISTGQPLGVPYDTVIPFEQVKNLEQWTLTHAPSKGQHVRQTGEVLTKGTQLLEKNTYIGYREQMLLLASGVTQVVVNKPLKIGILITGDEIVSHEALSTVETPSNGAIVETNSIMMRAFVNHWHMSYKGPLFVKDDETAFTQALEELTTQTDVVFISGGSSKGERDIAHKVLREQGKIIVEGIEMKPGKPFKTAVFRNKLILLLPGYPLAMHHVLSNVLEPALGFGKGLQQSGILLDDWVSSPSIEDYRLVKGFENEGKWHLELLGKTTSHFLNLSHSSGYVYSRKGSDGFKAGETVRWSQHQIQKGNGYERSYDSNSEQTID